jgi:hypothetical protein
MKTQIKMLKVKIKSLAAEARIIRLEEQRAKGRRESPVRRKNMGRGFIEADPAYLKVHGRDDELRLSLHQHRVRDVRNEQRSSLLAYAFLRGRPLAAVEKKAEKPPDWARVAKLVEKFGTVSNLKADKEKQAAEFGAWRQPVRA